MPPLFEKEKARALRPGLFNLLLVQIVITLPQV
jgi:hypothetical protein